MLITGAAGAIGTALRTGLRSHWRHLRLTDIRPVPDLAGNEELVVADIADRAAVENMMRGVKAVVHLAGIVGTYTLEDLFRRQCAGPVRRVRGRPAGRHRAHRVCQQQPCLRPLSDHREGLAGPAAAARQPYGVFKVWGETMLQHYYDRYGIRSVSLRIGTFRAQPIDQRSLATWLSPADVAHLVDVSLRHPDPGCMVVNGYSNNTRLKTFDPNWATLGYQPKDNAEDHREALRAKGVDVDAPDRGEWEWPEHGGSFPRTPDRPVR